MRQSPEFQCLPAQQSLVRIISDWRMRSTVFFHSLIDSNKRRLGPKKTTKKTRKVEKNKQMNHVPLVGFQHPAPAVHKLIRTFHQTFHQFMQIKYQTTRRHLQNKTNHLLDQLFQQPAGRRLMERRRWARDRPAANQLTAGGGASLPLDAIDEAACVTGQKVAVLVDLLETGDHLPVSGVLQLPSASGGNFVPSVFFEANRLC